MVSAQWVLEAVVGLARRTFLPSGYPLSVAVEYVEYQAWDSLQGLCSYVRGVLSTSAVLRAAGVGSASAKVGSAALTWLARDGVGTLGSLAFSCWIGSQVDGDLKRWRLFADVMNDIGLSLEVAAPWVSSTPNDFAFAFTASVAAACKAACGVASGTANAAISAHLARSPREMADVAAKEAAQETAVTLIGILCGILVAGADRPLAIFAVLTALHVYCNWRAVSCLRLNTMNPARAAIVFERYISKNIALDPATVAQLEPVFLPARGRPTVDLGARIPVASVHDRSVFDESVDARFALFARRPAVSAPLHVKVVLSRDASSKDILRALFQAIALHHRSSTVVTTVWYQAPLAASEEEYTACNTALAARGWDLERPSLHVGPYRYVYDASK